MDRQIWRFGDWFFHPFYGDDNLRQSPSLTLWLAARDKKTNELLMHKAIVQMTIYDRNFATTLSRLFAEKERERNGEVPNWPVNETT